jgi:transposase
MEYARVCLPDAPRGGLTAGIDWASAEHAVCVAGAAGQVVSRFCVAHTAAGLKTLVQGLARAGACEVAIERGDGPVVDALLAAGVSVVVISPRRVKNLRSRYGSAGNKDDRSGAYVLADVLRTDRGRLRPLIPDSPATVTLRQACRARQDLVRHRVAAGNQLRAHLLVAFPGGGRAVLRAGLGDQPGVLGPVRLPGPGQLAVAQTAGGLAEKRTLQRPYRPGCPVSPAEVRAARCHRPGGSRQRPGDRGPGRRAGQPEHPDQGARSSHRRPARRPPRRPHLHLAAALGHDGAARLLAEIGDCRARFPDPQALICLAGAAPSTRQSGKHKAVTFRWAVSKQLRDAVCDFADGSRHANPWAAQTYNDATARGKDHPHAVRILARAWLYVIWECWHHDVAYDPARHRALQRLLAAQDTSTDQAALPEPGNTQMSGHQG